MKYSYITDYKDDEKWRRSLNELTEKTFGFSFEEWYRNGFWGEKYISHSLVHGEKVIANVGVSLMDFEMDGIRKHYIQLGAVMTDKAYRGQGLSHYLIEKIIHEYEDRADGIYLFGNDSVLNFYPRFGFMKGEEYQYSKDVDSVGYVKKIEHVDMTDKANWKNLFDVLRNSIGNSRFAMDNLGIFAFWTTGFMRGSVYYLAEEEAYIIADVKGENLFIHQVAAEHKVDLEKVIRSFGSGIGKVILGFTPLDGSGYDVEELHEEDCTLFILGKDLENIEKKKLMFPTLSHA